MPPSISVVMSAYNEENYIREAIASILNQTWRDFEFIIINDGSTDRTQEIIVGFDDKRIVLLNNDRNLGLTRSLNKGLRAAKANLIARMDANDMAVQSRFQKQVAVFREHKDVDLVWTGAWYIARDGEYLCPKATPPFHQVIDLLKSCPVDSPVGRNHVNHMTVMFKKQSVVSLGGYSEEYLWGQDGVLWRRMLKSGARFYFLEEPLMAIRLVQTGVTSRRTGANLLNEEQYYSNVCLAHRHYVNALKHMLRMPWGMAKAKQAAKIPYRLLVASLHRGAGWALWKWL